MSRPPADARAFESIEPVFEELPGWNESTLGAKSLEQLPANARSYIRYLGDILEAPIDIVSTGPDRNETIILRNPYDVE